MLLGDDGNPLIPRRNTIDLPKTVVDSQGQQVESNTTTTSSGARFGENITMKVDRELKDNMVIDIPNLDGNGYVLHTQSVKNDDRFPHARKRDFHGFRIGENRGNTNEADIVDNSTPDVDIESLGRNGKKLVR
nr:hypothetical protein [Tanacetum cinerariifolium]